MSLDNFQLTPFLIKELYKDSLVTIDNQQLTPQSVKVSKMLCLGKNEKHILVIVDVDNAVYLEDNDLNFLIDILTACSLSISDIALMNLRKNMDAGYELLLEQFKPSIVLFFGVEPETIGFPLQFPEYQIQAYNNQTYLKAPTLEKLGADINEKKQFWASLKKLFSIK